MLKSIVYATIAIEVEHDQNVDPVEVVKNALITIEASTQRGDKGTIVTHHVGNVDYYNNGSSCSVGTKNL